jgi:hypothetical protein
MSTRVDESSPVFTVEAGAVILAVIRVCAGGLISHQVYAVTADTFELIAIELLYVDALMLVAAFKRYLVQGGCLAGWRAAHPHGVTVHGSHSRMSNG